MRTFVKFVIFVENRARQNVTNGQTSRVPFRSGGGEGGCCGVGRWNHEWHESARMSQEQANQIIREIRGSSGATECDRRPDLFASDLRRRGLENPRSVPPASIGAKAGQPRPDGTGLQPI